MLFRSLDSDRHIYLDYTGGNLYPQSLVLEHQRLLLGKVFGNPHSTNPTSDYATRQVEDARTSVLKFFNASGDYTCIFTSNASAALKIVGESYPFSPNSNFILLADNHNSVNGIREFCKAKGGTAHYVPVQYEDLMIPEGLLSETLGKHS